MKNITNYIKSLYNNSFINEKYGIYDGCEELIDLIIKDIFSHNYVDYQYEYIRKDFPDIKNIFFKKLVIDIDTSSKDEYGECDNDITINNDMLVDEVWINIYDQNPTKSSVRGILLHELTHAYNNYMMLLKGNKSFITTFHSNTYKNIIDGEGENAEQDLKFIMYFLLGYERNAFIAQLKNELEDHKDKINTPKDALEVLKKCPIYLAYMKVDNIIRYHFNNSKDSELIADLYRKITGSDKMESSSKILKRLKSQSDKALKKLNTIIPKLCVENLNNH